MVGCECGARIRYLGEGEVSFMCGSHGACVWLTNTDYMEYRHFYCYHETVAISMCATP